jgi:O-antigen ligase
MGKKMARYNFSSTALVIFGYPLIVVLCNFLNLNNSATLFGVLIICLFVISFKSFDLKRKYFLNIFFFFTIIMIRLFFDINTHGINVYGDGVSSIVNVFLSVFVCFFISYSDNSSLKVFLNTCKILVIILSILIFIFLILFHDISFDSRETVFIGLGVISLPFVSLLSIIVLNNTTIKFSYKLFMTLLFVLLIIISGSRSMIVITLFYFIYKLKVSFKYKLFVLPLIVSYIIYNINIDLFALNRVFLLYENFDETSRLKIYDKSLQLIIDNFYTGSSFRIPSTLGFSYPHNILLEITLGTGFFGLSLFLMLISRASKIVYKSIFLFELFFISLLTAQFSFSILTNFYLIAILGFTINNVINFEKNNSISSPIKL